MRLMWIWWSPKITWMTTEQNAKFAMYFSVFTQPLRKEMDAIPGPFISGVQLIWHRSFLSPRPIAIPRLKNPVFSERIVGFIHFLRELPRSETQTALSKIWTRVTNFISYDDNRFIASTTFLSDIYLLLLWWVHYLLFFMYSTARILISVNLTKSMRVG